MEVEGRPRSHSSAMAELTLPVVKLLCTSTVKPTQDKAQSRHLSAAPPPPPPFLCPSPLPCLSSFLHSLENSTHWPCCGVPAYWRWCCLLECLRHLAGLASITCRELPMPQPQTFPDSRPVLWLEQPLRFFLSLQDALQPRHQGILLNKTYYLGVLKGPWHTWRLHSPEEGKRGRKRESGAPPSLGPKGGKSRVCRLTIDHFKG